MPLADKAATTALTPGIGTTFMPASRTIFTTIAPGSLTAGVPASVTSAILSPYLSCANSLSPDCCSLCSCTAINFLLMPKCDNKPEVCRVSSAAMASTNFSVSIARNVMSPKLPIGVAITYNVPCSNISDDFMLMILSESLHNSYENE